MASIKFCENNFTFGIESLIEKLENEHGVSVDVEPCLGYCGDCSEGPFALVEDKLVKADTAEDLYNEIEQLI